jgi:hypothetical protein
VTQLAAAKRDLAASRRALEAMRAAQSLDAIEAAWRSFLQEANKVWTKVELACKSHPKAQPWFGGHARLRKKDMLLRYLHHARNSDEHTLTEIVSRQPGGFAINPAPGMKGVYIDSMTISSGPSGTHINYRGSPIQVEVHTPHVQLERVFDRGAWFNPPTQHLDKRLMKNDPITVAELGYTYCERIVSEAESRFFPPSA